MADLRTNDNAPLTPKTTFSGPALAFDFPGVRIGCAEYAEGPTGCTVFHFPQGASLAVDVRGGAVGVVGAERGWVHAICLAGGSLYGLEAAFGVQAELFAQSGYSVEMTAFPLVSGAIIYDYGGRDTRIYPDKALGRAATRATREGWFPLGPVGAGRNAGVGGRFSHQYRGERGGQGAAFGQWGPLKAAVFSVVNANGVIVDRSGQVVRGCLDRATGQRVHPATLVRERAAEPYPPTSGDTPAVTPTENTTLTVLVTNLKLGSHHLSQLGRTVHTSMARAIQPFQTAHDGDVLFTVSTNTLEIPGADGHRLGVLASELAWDAVLASF